MTQRRIVRLGDPALRTPAEPVDPARLGDPGLQELIDDMIETMLAAPGVGLAAPQLGVGLQIFVYRGGAEDDSGIGVVVNPSVEPLPGELIYEWEGCLSIPSLRGLVPRHPAVCLYGLDRHGRKLDLEAVGFVARIVQHEYDHLHGVLFLDRMRDMRSLSFEEEWHRFLGDGEPTAVG